MRIVIDTNMIFSLLLGKNEALRDVFFDVGHTFFAPNYIVGELFEKKEKIMKCSALTEVELYELLYRILSRIRFIAEEFVASAHKLHAFNLCKDIDEDDIPFIALSLQLDALFWTGDRRLKESLIRQGIHILFCSEDNALMKKPPLPERSRRLRWRWFRLRSTTLQEDLMKKELRKHSAAA